MVPESTKPSHRSNQIDFQDRLDSASRRSMRNTCFTGKCMTAVPRRESHIFHHLITSYAGNHKSMDFETYHYITRHIVPGPQDVSYFLPLILLPIALATPRSVLTRWQNIAIFMPLITACSIRAWIAMEGVDVISVNTLLWSAFLLVFQDPWKDFRFLLDRGTGEGNVRQPDLVGEAYPLHLCDRLLWIGKLLASIRLDFWKIGHPSHDRQQPPAPAFSNARSFLIYSAWSLANAFIILDATRAYIEYDAYYHNSEVSISSPLPFSALHFIPPKLLRTMVAGAQAYALIGEMFYLPAAIPVFFSWVGVLPERYSPHAWPAYFGSPVAILKHGVRGFWGSFWHQTMRWTTSGPGYAIADGLGLQHGGLLRYAILSVSAFGLSGIVHAGLVPPEPRYTRDSVQQIRLKMAGFFWAQAIAACIEAGVGRVVTASTGPWRTGSRLRIRMLLNLSWTICWFSLSLPLLTDAARQLGSWQPWPLPLSLWRWYHGEGLFAWSNLRH